MITFVRSSNVVVEALIATFRNKEKIVLSNYFGLPKDGECDFSCEGKTMLVRIKEYHFYRLFFLSSDLQDLKTVLWELNGDEYVVNIPTKIPIKEMIQLLEETGFKLIGEYSRYYNKSIESAYSFLCKISKGLETDSKCELAQKARIDEIDQIEKLLRNNFSLYTDHLPDEEELEDKIIQNTVYVNRYDGEVCGVEIFTPTTRMCYGNAWIDKKGLGIFLSKEVYHYLMEHNIKVMNFWVNNNNKKVIQYHKMLGSVPDGLIDYSFLKK